jgi:hypothetical protein
MSFFEIETWKIKKGCQADHNQMIGKWFAYVQEHHDEMFSEWRSARYFQEVNRNSGKPTGRYMMIFEYCCHEGFLSYKERRKDWTGPYAEYKQVDPYRFFDLETVTESYWTPNEKGVWLDFDTTKSLPSATS